MQTWNDIIEASNRIHAVYAELSKQGEVTPTLLLEHSDDIASLDEAQRHIDNEMQWDVINQSGYRKA